MLNTRVMILLLAGWLGATASAIAQSETPEPRYASHSVLAEGRWVKIRIPETGLYQITDSVAQLAGFTDAAHVSVWGYGGALQPDLLSESYLISTDDLKEQPSFYYNGRRLFYGVGPVNWTSTGSDPRIRNYYSSYGYYFLTDAPENIPDIPDSPDSPEYPENDEGSDDPIIPDESEQQQDSIAFVSTFYPSSSDYHSIYEKDDYAWYSGGRQLFAKELFKLNEPRTYQLPAYSGSGSVTLAMVFKKKFTANVYVNDSLVSTITPGSTVVSPTTGSLIDAWAKAGYYLWRLPVNNLTGMNTIAIEQLTGSSLRLDYVAINSNSPRPMCELSDSLLPMPEIVGLVAPQDRHADPQADMVIIIPANRVMQEQAERLKQLHEQADGLRVTVVPADELYNEFSSGTPDGNAYRRYMKMLYDRAETPDDRPRFLLLFGDGAWDNRLILSDWGTATQDDYLLCYESENSYSETKCYTSDDYFGLLADGKGKSKDSMLRSDQLDLAVGRFPVSTPEDAAVMVDKVVNYYSNAEAGPWQNLLCFMGDDGNQNMHMNDAEVVISEVEKNYSGFNIQKIYWDAYKRETSTAGDRYPDVERLVKQNMQNGALLMNYTGHGGPRSLSHEYVLRLADFETVESTRLPFWMTASCDIMAFDGHEKTLGEVAVLAPHGGAIGFFGTARTVYAYFNQYMNRYFTRHLLGSTNGRRNTIGEAAKLAKNELMASGDDQTENKFQYVLLGDPALVLAAPTLDATIETINGQPVGNGIIELPAGKRVTIEGTIVGHDDFEGKLSITVFDAEQTIMGQKNNKSQTDTAIVFRDYPNIIYTGTQRVSGGRFSFTFTVTRDLSYTDAPAKIVLYAVSDDLQLMAHGENRDFKFVEGQDDDGEGEGPQITCYLNDDIFSDGRQIEQQAIFMAALYDEDGINSSGSGIGHDIELVIDKKIAYTYNLNGFFESINDDYRQGVVAYQLPILSYGPHQLRFRAWDMLNNSSSVTLRFEVVDPLGISNVSTDTVGTSEFFDATGRKLGSKPPRKGLYICRTSNGQVKKLTNPKQ